MARPRTLGFRWMIVAAISCQFHVHLLAQASLDLSSAIATPDTVTNLSLSMFVSGAAPAALEWTLTYAPNQIRAVNMTVGPAAVAAGKNLSCVLASGLYKCLLTGLNTTPVGSGIVAYVQVVVATNISDSSIAISDTIGVDGTGTELAISAGSGATIVVPVLSAVTCMPAVLYGGGSASCSATLNTVAPAGGVVIALSSNNSALTAPASVTVLAGTSSAQFTAVAGVVTASQTGTLTGLWNGGSQSTALSLTPQAGLSGLGCNPATLGPAMTTGCTLSLTNAAPAGGYVIALSASTAELTVPSSVTAIGGASNVNFTATAAGLIGKTESATVTATLNGTSANAVVLLQPAAAPTISSLSPFSVTAGSQTFTLIVNGNAFSADAVIQWNGTPLVTTFINSGQLDGAVPASLVASAGTVAIAVEATGGVSSAAVKFTVTGPVPGINSGGVVPVYSSSSSFQAGSWVSIFGNDLANGTFLWSGDFPTSLGGVSVSIDNRPAYLAFVSPGQINLQVPDDATIGTVPVVVTTPGGKATSSGTLAPFGPSFVRFDIRYAAGVILTPDGSGAYGGGTYDLLGPPGYFTFDARPATEGDTLELYGTGFGPTNPQVPAGQPFSGAAEAINGVTVMIGGVSAKVLFAGITSPGLYQINIIVPAVGGGDQLLQASVGGVSTPGQIFVTTKVAVGTGIADRPPAHSLEKLPEPKSTHDFF